MDKSANPVATKKILITEDEELLRASLRAKLESQGFAVVEARDGVEGLEVAFREHPDLILLDILMPRVDGIEMLRRLRYDDWGAGAKVVFLTNLTGEEKIKQAQSDGALDFILKATVTLEDVIKIVKKYTS